ncbi:hypothetical protein Ddc_06634 [Ditylenchus destructor]|nr:hypothetical protein Ddc_06634 [Ditylenchus destructor]
MVLFAFCPKNNPKKQQQPKRNLDLLVWIVNIFSRGSSKLHLSRATIVVDPYYPQPRSTTIVISLPGWVESWANPKLAVTYPPKSIECGCVHFCVVIKYVRIFENVSQSK